MGPLSRLIVFALLAYFAYNYLRRLMSPPQRRDGAPNSQQIQDLSLCAVCQTYRAGGAASCGRPDCPGRP